MRRSIRLMFNQLANVPNIDESEFKIIKNRIAEGYFGKIDLAKYGEEYVAVKWLDERYLKLNCREAQILKDCNHPNILRIYGAGLDVKNCHIKYLLFEWATNGDLKKIIQNKMSYTIWHIMLWCLHITRGLRYLHTYTPMIILHRDIKPHNMLLFNECTILKIADFGGSRFGKDGLSQPPPFTQGFASPELISTDDYDETVDIYAFGMTLKCLLMKSCNLYSTGDVRWYSPFLTNLIARCTSTDINDRPSADQLMRIFDIAFEKIYADDIKKLKLETPYCEIENVVEPKLNTHEHERVDRTTGDSQDKTLVPDGKIPSFNMNELPRLLRPCYINESTNAPAYQKYVEHAANYVKEKKEIANVQKEIDDLLNEIIERSRVPESDQARAKQMMLLYAEMETERCRRDTFSI
ncbi:unnamed protein product [Hymenolepis diminuta]|uniref:Protein kinase domain-containing protein n=1 Tax=Hymenolepis diminuta TaxID=6216 RepID=A0A564Z4A0_HYMDI|nr:unnamed protein product [Hymenolepis diminuta]